MVYTGHERECGLYRSSSAKGGNGAVHQKNARQKEFLDEKIAKAEQERSRLERA